MLHPCVDDPIHHLLPWDGKRSAHSSSSTPLTFHHQRDGAIPASSDKQFEQLIVLPALDELIPQGSGQIGCVAEFVGEADQQAFALIPNRVRGVAMHQRLNVLVGIRHWRGGGG